MSDSIYRERARLTAFLASVYPSTIGITDPDEPDWAVLTVETPEGQLSWHVSKEDLDLFGHVPWDHEVKWDGHTTEEKYERLTRLIEERI